MTAALTAEAVAQLLIGDGKPLPDDYEPTGVADAIRPLAKSVRVALICGLHDRAELALLRAEQAETLAMYTTPEAFRAANLKTAASAALLWKEACHAI